MNNSVVVGKIPFGVLRFDSFNISLGQILAYLNELLYWGQINNCNEVRLAIVGEIRGKDFVDIIESTNVRIGVQFFDDIKTFRESLIKLEYQLIPSNVTLDNLDTSVYDYASFARTEDLFVKYKIRPIFLSFLRVQNKVLSDFHSHNIGSAPFVCVHLKQISNIAGKSNANLKIWKNVFEHYSLHKSKIKFVLVGHDSILSEIENISNVISLNKSKNIDLISHLHLIQKGQAFLGMSSGLCQMAIFSHIPYLIFKNPDHHFNEMSQILKQNKLFSFSHENQIFLQENETVDRIIHFVDSLKLQ